MERLATALPFVYRTADLMRSEDETMDLALRRIRSALALPRMRELLAAAPGPERGRIVLHIASDGTCRVQDEGPLDNAATAPLVPEMERRLADVRVTHAVGDVLPVCVVLAGNPGQYQGLWLVAVSDRGRGGFCPCCGAVDHAEAGDCQLSARVRADPDHYTPGRW